MIVRKHVLFFLICFAMLLIFAPQFQLPAAALAVAEETTTPLSLETPELLAQGRCGHNAYWSLDSTGTLTITGTGQMFGYTYIDVSPWTQYALDIKTIVISDGITSIGSRSFINCSNVTSVTFGQNLTEIWDDAFYGCSGLTQVVLPDSVTTLRRFVFQNCTNLTSVTIGKGLTTIGQWCFSSCSSLTEVHISDLAAWSQINCYDSSSNPLSHAKNLYLDHQLVTDVEIPSGVTAIGDYVFYGYPHLTKLVLPDTLTSIGSGAFGQCQSLSQVVIPEGVTTIGTNAFISCVKLTEIQIPDAVTDMGINVFRDCTSLTDVSIGKGLQHMDSAAFSNCTALTNITFEAIPKTIGSNAFYNCTALTNVYITDLAAWCSTDFSTSYSTPLHYAQKLYLNNVLLTNAVVPEGVTRIGINAFRNCAYLTKVTLPQSVTVIGENAFYGCTSLTTFTFPDQMTSIGKYAFYNCSCLTQVIFPQGITVVNEYTFYNCSKLTEITIPDSVTTIEGWAFYKCSSIPQIILPEGLTTIGSSAFYGCKSLTAINIPESVTSIGGAFAGCSTITEIFIPDGITAIANFTFDGCTSLKKITIPETVTSIGDYAFRDCESLTEIDLPDGLTSLGKAAFYDCTHLRQITIPDGVTAIGESTFAFCANMTQIQLPESLTSIGDYAFWFCLDLERIVIPENVTSMGNRIFGKCNRLFGIWFMGPAPKMSTEFMDGTQTLIFYDCTDASWSNLSKSPYGSYITWKGHLYNDYTYNYDSTCSQDGTQTGICTVCGKDDTITAPGSASHRFDKDKVCIICDQKTELVIKMTSDTIYGWRDASISVYKSGKWFTDVTLQSGMSGQINIPYDPSQTYSFQWNPSKLYAFSANIEICFSGVELLAISGDHCPTTEYFYTLNKVPIHDYEIVSAPESCLDPSPYTKVCTICGDRYVYKTDNPGHNYSTVNVEPTCTTDGSITNTCTNCGDQLIQILPATGHSNTVQRVEATCITDGYETATCTVCGNISAQTFPKLGHKYQTTTTIPTCTENGTVHAVCEHCGHEFNSYLPASGHQFTDGICGICGAEDPDTVQPAMIPTLTLKAPTLEFKDMITVNAMFTAENLDDVVEMGMITYSSKVDAWNVETAEHMIPGTTYDASTGLYIAASQGIHAKHLGDEVYLACYAKLTDGSYVYTKLASYSPVQYAVSKLKGNDVPLKQLVVAMLNYGAAAQIHFGHNTQNLANAALSPEQITLPEAYRNDMVSTVASPSAEKQGAFANNNGFAKRYPSISFEGAFCINYFFTPAYTPVGQITLYYWNVADYEAAEVLTAENATGSLTMELLDNGEYRGDITGIAAKALSEGIYVAGVYTDGTNTQTSGVLGYSIGAYCASQSTKGGTIGDLAMATAVYGYQAKAYFR